MSVFAKNRTSIATTFQLKSIVSVEELANHDMIYIYHHLKTGDQLTLKENGTNVKGHLRYAVCFKDFLLGYITLDGLISDYYAKFEEVEAEITALEKKKFMPISAMDITIRPVKLRMVS